MFQQSLRKQNRIYLIVILEKASPGQSNWSTSRDKQGLPVIVSQFIAVSCPDYSYQVASKWPYCLLVPISTVTLMGVHRDCLKISISYSRYYIQTSNLGAQITRAQN